MRYKISDLAKLLDVSTNTVRRYEISQTTYSRYESGALDIPSATIIRLARFYHVSTDYLFGLTDEDRPYPCGKYGG